MKAYLLTVLIVDHDDVGMSGAADEIENARYGNRCIIPEVVADRKFDIGEWEDDHPLNYPARDRLGWLKEHGREE